MSHSVILLVVGPGRLSSPYDPPYNQGRSHVPGRLILSDMKPGMSGSTEKRLLNSRRYRLRGLALHLWTPLKPLRLRPLVGIFISLALFTISSSALDPARQISQYAHTAWRISDGFFNGTPQAIAQTADGYLWIGTEAGLVRFDGVRFVPWTAPNGEHLPSSRIHSLLGTRDGSLWIGTTRGLVRWNNFQLTGIQGGSGFIESLVEGPQGKVWITRSQLPDHAGPLCEVAEDALHCHGASEGIPFPFAQPLFGDAQGSLWFGGSLAVGHWSPGEVAPGKVAPGEVKTFPLKALQGNDLLRGVTAITSGSDGLILAGVERTGGGLGLQQLTHGEWKDYSLPQLNGVQLSVTALLRDRNEGLWIGTANSGVYHVHAGQAEHFGGADGLSSDSVQSFYEDREGNIWVATSRGIDRFHDTPVVSFSIHEGLTSEDADSVFAAHDGTVWIGNLQALDFLRQGKLSSIAKRNGLPGRLITSLLEDDQHRLWVGIDNGLAVYDNGKFQPVKRPDGKPLGIVTALIEDTDHNVWASVTQPALFRIQNLKVEDEFVPPQVPRVASMAADVKEGVWLGLSNGVLARLRHGQLEPFPTHRPADHAIRNLLVEPDDSIWGATQDGAFLWREGKEEILDSHNGLGCDEIYTILQDNNGLLWLDTQCGFVVIAQSEIYRWWQQPDIQIKTRTFDVFDGAQPGLTNFRPEGSKAPDGKLWFANENVLQTIDPEHLDTNKVSPPVQVEQIVADRKKYTPRENLRLPPHTRDIEIDYTALSFVAPEKVRFRYKLEGHDSEWRDPQNRRQAFYTNLPPGNYRFRVIASNNDGVWNEAGAEAGFAVLPAFYQTALFRILCVVAAAGMLGLFYVLRLRRLTAAMHARFEERLEVRERIARNLHDTLLQGIYSASLHLDLANSRILEDSPAKPAVERSLDLLRQVSQEGRNALRSLRSRQTSSEGLEQALSLLPKEFALPENIEFVVATDGQPRVLRPLVRDEAYLIAREAVINAFRHAQASKIEVDVGYASRHLRVTVRDNGCGIDSQLVRTGRDGHWGLPGMRERAEKIGGKLKVLSGVDAGTEIELSVPGVLAFQDSSTGRFQTWPPGLYPPKRRGKLHKSSEEQKQ
jgi:signal transduction histidine kinase/ligand-binding sensor domain-containing protein